MTFLATLKDVELVEALAHLVAFKQVSFGF